MIRYTFLSLSLTLLCAACSTQNDSNPAKVSSLHHFDPSDAHSYANIKDVRTEHLHLELDVNFENQTVYGVARHQLSEHKVKTAVFDVKELEIMKVTIGSDAKEETATDYSIGKNDALLGAPLNVTIKNNTRFVNIYYKTTQATEALDWLPASLTEGKKHPFMYTQGQAILTRSWIPLQDTPLNRITYSADVQTPKGLMAIMSASNPKKLSADGKYHFKMEQKIPAYLIALAVGNLVYSPLGEKTGVYSEPEIADAATYEFADVPKMMKAAEELYGAYRWDQYDIVMLPYSFPFGGMENPRLTFANPTILAGDRSLVSVIAHELAHSWSGNLVTNATWNDFWLNEGFTVYFENRIMEKLYGKEIADILALIEYQDLEASLESIMVSEHPEDSKLKLELNHRNPDDGMTDIAYIKGAYFLRTLEKAVGRKEFDAFLENYFNSHAFETITTEKFVEYLNNELLKPKNITFNTKEWIYSNGLPDNCVKTSSKRLEFMEKMAAVINIPEKPFPKQFAGKERGDYITQEWQTLIRKLSPSLSVDKMAELDRRFHFSKDANPAIKSDWYQLCIKTGYKAARPDMRAYLIKIGRRWFIESIYQCLMDSKDASDPVFAKAVFEEAKSGYHFVSRSTIAEIVNPTSKK